VIRSRDQVQAEIRHLEDRWYDVVDGGWSDFSKAHKALRAAYTVPRVQAILVHQYMENRARAIFAGEAGIYMPEVGEQLFFLNYQNRYIIKPRMLYRDFTVASNNTRLAWSFEDQDQLPLPFMPDPVTNLHLGYLLNATRTGMASAHIVCPDGVGGTAWEWTLQGGAEAAGPITMPIPAPTTGPRARPKEAEPAAAEERRDAAGS
jgi:hypothetical protein